MHEVGAADVSAHGLAAGQHAGGLEPGGPLHHPGGDDPVAHDGPFAVHVVKEGVQRPGPLDQAGPERGPVLRCDHPRDEVHREQPGAGFARHAEGDPLGPLLIIAGPLASAQPTGAEPFKLVDQRHVGVTDRPVGGHHLISRSAVADHQRCGERRVRGRRPVSRRAGQEVVDHVGEATAAGEHTSLLLGAGAVAQRPFGQARHLLPVAGRFQVGSQVLEQTGHGERRGDRTGRTGQVDQLALQARPRRPPHRGALQRRRGPRGGQSCCDGVALASHQRAEQPRHQDDIVDIGTRVGDPQLEGRQVGRGADVEVDHPRVGDGPRPHQVGDQRIVLGRSGAPVAARGWPPLPGQ